MKKKTNKAPLVEKKDGKMQLSPSHMAAIEKTENVGTAMMQTAQEYTIAMEQVLIDDFGFTEEQLQHLEGRLREMLVTLADVERKGLSVLSFHDMKSVAEIAQIRYNRLIEQKTGLVLPKGKVDNG